MKADVSRTPTNTKARDIAIRASVLHFVVAVFLAVCTTEFANARQLDGQRMILAHYMPWHESNIDENFWGWHWTMNHFDPKLIENGERQIASHFYPEIGPYDSGDPAVLEYQLLLMKLSGIDGIIVDWYGLQDFNDYKILHRNTQQVVQMAERLGMKFAVCYEDQTIPVLIKAGKISDAVNHAQQEIEWLNKNWFGLSGYVRRDDRPVLLSFGHSGLKDEEWAICLDGLGFPVDYFSEHRRRSSAAGAFDWPIPDQGLNAIAAFNQNAKKWPASISVAYPRFKDIYAQAKVHKSWGEIPDDNGLTFRQSLEKAIASNSFMIQIATWNDWGEGTMVEPSKEFGLRDLFTIQELRHKHLNSDFRFKEADLKLPARLFKLRQGKNAAQQKAALDAISNAISAGDLDNARIQLNAVE